MILHLLTLFLSLITPILATEPLKALVAPITLSGSLYAIIFERLNQNENLILDIESPFSWHRCPTSFPHVSCLASQCLDAQSSKSLPCHRTLPKRHPKLSSCTCFTLPYNPITKACASSQLTYTNFSMSSTDGHVNLAKVNYDDIFLSCAPESLVVSLPNDTLGVASLSRGSLSLVSQFSSQNVPKKFGLCLSDRQGVAFFGEGPFYLRQKFPPDTDVTSLLRFTSLVNHPRDNHGYYINLKAISVDGQALKISKRLLSLNAFGNGGVKISTVIPYTKLRSKIYRALLRKFANATSGIPRVPNVAPFDLCLNTSKLEQTEKGSSVPQIDLELNDGGKWSIFGFNSMKSIGNHVECLAFVDGGERAKQAMVIGLHQMQDNFMLFDLEKSKLGFSPLLFSFQITCHNFFFR